MKRKRPTNLSKRWGVFNYETLWDVFVSRRDARDYAKKQIGCDEAALAKRIRDKSISIVKVTVMRERWINQWSPNKP